MIITPSPLIFKIKYLISLTFSKVEVFLLLLLLLLLLLVLLTLRDP